MEAESHWCTYVTVSDSDAVKKVGQGYNIYIYIYLVLNLRYQEALHRVRPQRLRMLPDARFFIHPASPIGATLRYQEALDWRKWTKGGMQLPSYDSEWRMQPPLSSAQV